MEKTIVIQIGNSDDKLSQREWYTFLKVVSEAVTRSAVDVHFYGCSPSFSPWQNAAWVVVGNEVSLNQLKDQIHHARSAFLQDSAAWTEGFTSFI